MTRTVKFKGNPITISGTELKVGDAAPNFKLTKTDMSDISLDDYSNQVVVLSVLPSLDTPVCALQTKRFNKEAENLSKDVQIVTVSLDLPFAQTRWCGAEEVENLITASDYKYREFGEQYGTYLPDLGLHARAIFVINKDKELAYVEYVSEVAEEPNYEATLEILQSLT